MKTLILSLLGFALCSSLAAADVRNALVIGNGAYEAVGSLDNPTNDAKLMAATLRDLDFNVIEVINASQIEMKRAVRDFGSRLNEAGREGVGLFYYAGHGLQVGGANYIIPVDAKIDSAGDVDIEAINANSVLSMMEYSNARLSFVVLDACRNNPYSRGFRSATRGLAKMNAPTGSFIAYATSPGDVAVDGDGENSPYTASLVSAMQEPGIPIEKMFRNVRNEVRSITDNRQTPWESSSLIGDDFYFKTRIEIADKPTGQEITVTTEKVPLENGQGTAAVSVNPPAAAMQPLVIRNDSNIELMFWESVKDARNPALLEAYVNKYPEGIFVELARLKIEAVGASQAQSLAAAAATAQTSAKATEVVVSKTPAQPVKAPEPEPVKLAVVNNAPKTDNTVAKKLKECAGHVRAKRLTTGAGGNALDCYRVVLDKDPGNAKAMEGLSTIENKYTQWASSSLDQGNLERAARNIRKLRSVNGDNPQLVMLEDRLDAMMEEQEQEQNKVQEQQSAPKQKTQVASAQPAKPAGSAGGLKKCDQFLAAGNLTGRGASNAYNCYQAALASNKGNEAAREGLAKVELALYKEFTDEVSDKSLNMAKGTLNELRRANPRSKHLRKMNFKYEELKMEMRW